MRRLFLVLVLGFFAGRLRAQTTETPVAFDSAQRVVAITPALVERLRLTAPIWPVSGEFRDARLYAVQPAGGYVIVVQRPTGAFERFPLTDAQRASLRSTIDVAMAVTGRPTSEVGSDVISEPAGNAFARRQTILAAVAYAPVAASMSDDGAAAGALYLLTTGATFFITYGITQSTTVTRAQNHLAGWLGVDGGAAGWLAGYALTGNTDKPVRAVALGSALAGTIAGYNLGRGLSDAEAHAAGLGIQATALTALALSNVVEASDRSVAGAVAASELIGYPLGLAYPRSTSYTVTAGDVDAVATSGLIGALYGGALVGKDPKRSTAAAVIGATYLGGLLAGDQLIARPYDLTASHAGLAGFGALAGGLVGLAIPTLAGSDNSSFLFGAAALGASFGMAAVVGSSNVHRTDGASPAPSAPPGRRSHEAASARRGMDVSFSPPSLLPVLRGVPGRYSLVNVRF